MELKKLLDRISLSRYTLPRFALPAEILEAGERYGMELLNSWKIRIG